MSEKCNHDVYERLAVADTMCIICLQDHIHSLEEKVKELEAIERLSKDSIMRLFDSKEQVEARVKELEDVINNTGCLVLKNSIGKSKEVETDLQDYGERNPLVEQLSERIKELEEKVKELGKEITLWKCSNDNWVIKFRDEFYKREQAEFKVKVLMEEGGQDCRQHNLMVEQLSERIKELETDLKLRDSHEEQPAK